MNTTSHQAALTLFLVFVLAHWAEHVAQAFQIWVLGTPVPEARGVLGEPFPWLIKSEALHVGYAVGMFVGLLLLRPGFTGRARTWWTVARGIQTLPPLRAPHPAGQAQTGVHPLGRPVQASVLRLLFPRVELHVFHNAVVFIRMVVAMALQMASVSFGARIDDAELAAR